MLWACWIVDAGCCAANFGAAAARDFQLKMGLRSRQCCLPLPTIEGRRGAFFLAVVAAREGVAWAALQDTGYQMCPAASESEEDGAVSGRPPQLLRGCWADRGPAAGADMWIENSQRHKKCWGGLLLLSWRDGLFGVPERLSWKEPREQVEASILSSNLPELRSGRSNLAQGWPCTIFSFERDFGMSSCRDCSGTCQKPWHPKARLSAPMQSGQRRSPDIAGAKRARNADSPLSTHVLICLK